MSAAESSPVLSFVDLDDTLFRSPARGGHGRPVTVDRAGDPYSYMSPAEARLFALLRRAGRVIPTTLRDPEQVDRVQLPFDDHIICANGAIILDPTGEPDPAWQAEVERRRARLSPSPTAVAELARTRPGGAALRVETVHVAGRPLLVDVRERSRDPAPLQRWAEAMADALPAGWMLDVAHDRALIYPAAIDKAAAVDWFIAHRVDGPTLIMGAGDRQSDRGFLARGHFAIVPTDSVLFASLDGPLGGADDEKARP